MKKISVLLLVLGTWFNLGAQTETPETPDPAQAPADPFKLQLQGDHQFTLPFSVYPDDWGFGGEQKTPRMGHELQVTAGTDKLKAVSQWKVENYLFAPSSGAPETWRLKPLENYIQWSPEGFKLAAGWQTWAWGAADGKNPTDTLNPRDYSVGLQADKIPAFGISASWYPAEGLTLDGVYIPYTQADIFPLSIADGIPASLFTPNPRSVQGNNLLAQNPQAYTLGARLRLKAGEWDLAGSYVYGWDTFPTPVLKLQTGPTYFLTQVTLERQRLHRVGLNAKTTLGDFGLWGEAGLDITQNPGADAYNLRHPKLSWTLGGDVNFGENSANYLNLQYFGEFIFNYDKDFTKDYPSGPTAVTDKAYMDKFYHRALVQSLGSQDQGFLQGLVFNLKLPFADNTLTFDAKGALAVPLFYDDVNETRYLSAGLNPELDLMPMDSFHIVLGASLAYTWIKNSQGDLTWKIDGDSIGTYTPGNRVYLQVGTKWTQDWTKKE